MPGEPIGTGTDTAVGTCRRTRSDAKPVPDLRITVGNGASVNAEGDFVLYWMTAFRRAGWNFSLQRAVEWARQLNKPMLVLEALRCDYPWASERIHTFILEGMGINQARFEGGPAFYYPFVEPAKGAGKGLLEALGGRACIVVADDFPAFFLPRMVRSAARKLSVRLELVDSNGLLPLRSAQRPYLNAHSFRRLLQRELRGHLGEFPAADPLAGVSLPPFGGLSEAIAHRWPPAAKEFLTAACPALQNLPLDHEVPPVALRGGSEAAQQRLRGFLQERLAVYHLERYHPDADATSGLSPYLHFGHLAVQQIVAELIDWEEWSQAQLADKASGRRTGWWGMGEGPEAFLDELVTWRELGLNMCSYNEAYDRLESLPEWALLELRRHAADSRPYLYSLDEFAAGKTHDALWNAAQSQLLQEGRIHNYLRMLWGKKILHWSASPQEALHIMLELNNRYALDGRDPNSYSGIFWIFGRYDRPWGPSRAVFGKIRYMSSKNTLRKVRVKEYLEAHRP